MNRHHWTNKISSLFLLATIISLGIDFTEQLTWKSKSRTIHACKGNTTDMIWDFEKEGAKISRLEWYFNDLPLISSSSDTKDLKIEPQYYERIEIIGNSSIRLKNLSLADEGSYTLFPVFVWHTSDSVQTISLKVIEPPSEKCRGMINMFEHPSKLMCDIPSSDCGRPQLTAVWKRSNTFEVLGVGSYFVVNASIRDQEILCCPDGTSLTCADFVSDTLCTSFRLADIAMTSTTSYDSPQRHSPTEEDRYRDSSSGKNLVIIVSLVICAFMSIVGTIISFLVLRKLDRIKKVNRRSYQGRDDDILQPLQSGRICE